MTVAVLLPADLPFRFRGIAAWDTLAFVYLAQVLLTVARTHDSARLKKRAAQEDESRWIILILMTGAAFVCAIAIATLLTNMKELSDVAVRLHLLAVAATVLLSWSMMHTMFAVHYAHEYYGDINDDPELYAARAGLAFPNTAEPDFWDFLYFSFVVGMTCQVSDVQVTKSIMRRLTLAHGLLAFMFNTIVLAISVNVAAGLIS